MLVDNDILKAEIGTPLVQANLCSLCVECRHQIHTKPPQPLIVCGSLLVRSQESRHFRCSKLLEIKADFSNCTEEFIQIIESCDVQLDLLEAPVLF